jgi:hypothetical protein
MTRASIALVVALAAGVSAAEAQVTVSGGLDWTGGYDIGTSSAQLRANTPGATPPPYTLFNVDARIAPAPGAEVRVGVVVRPQFTVEGGVMFARRRLPFRIFGDAEIPSESFAGESLQHFLFDAGVQWELPGRFPPRLRAFASGGAGYLRQLHQDRTLVESGQVYYAGGGARYWLRGLPDSDRSIGVRGDVRVNVRRGAIEFEERTRIYPTVSVLMFIVL